MPRAPGLFIMLLLAASAGACGGGRHGGGGRSYTTRPERAPVGPADLAAMRALLARMSPTGHAVLTGSDTVPTRFTFGSSTFDVTSAQGFGDYFPDGHPDDLVNNMETAVHEVYHGYSPRLGLVLQQRTGASTWVRSQGVFVGGDPILVRYSATMPAREMDATFPTDTRTRRYPYYVSPSQERHATQVEGVFGLLDEWTAYFHGGRVRVDLWPWVRDEAPVSQQLLVNYTAQLHEMWMPYAEFKLFILHYLVHARDHRPEVYAGLLANADFRRAFAAVDAAWRALLREAEALVPVAHAFARARGLDVGLADGELTFDGNPFPIRDPLYPAVLRVLASPTYQEIETALR